MTLSKKLHFLYSPAKEICEFPVHLGHRGMQYREEFPTKSGNSALYCILLCPKCTRNSQISLAGEYRKCNFFYSELGIA